MGRVLIIGKDGSFPDAARLAAALPDTEIEVSRSSVEALQAVGRRAFEVAVTDADTSIAEDLCLAHAITATPRRADHRPRPRGQPR
jgi:hypothetical protein